MIMFFFFFSSRRRHTRFKCDWSSDVCSSDLPAGEFPRSIRKLGGKMRNHALMRAGGGIRPLEGVPDPAIARELRLPKSRSRLQLGRLPESPFGRGPFAVGLGYRR